MEKITLLKPTLCVVAGHSGGHILPARTLADEWLHTNPQGTCIFFSTDKQLDKHVLYDTHGTIVHVPLAIEPLSLKKFWRIPIALTKYIRSCIKSYRYLAQQPVQKVITTGGHVALPVCIAAKLLNIPIELYELNAVPGKAIHLLSHIAQTIYVCFPYAQHYFTRKKCLVATYPLQPSLQKNPLTKKEARNSLQLDPLKTTVLVLGGSQGSIFINNLIKKWLPYASRAYKNLQIIHQTGNQDTTDWQAFYKKYNLPFKAFPYYHDMHQLYSAADIIICRAGAGSLFEAVHFKKNCITIPLEAHAGNHQVINAQAIKKQYPELIHILYQSSLTNDISNFTTTVQQLLHQAPYS